MLRTLWARGTEPRRDTEEIEGGMAECSEADGEIFPSPWDAMQWIPGADLRAWLSYCRTQHGEGGVGEVNTEQIICFPLLPNPTFPDG